MNLQPHLQNEIITLVPLSENDFEALYLVASDPLIWEQHPNKNRYQREVFQTFFQGAVASRGAFLVYDSQSHQLIGSSRFYDYDSENKSILIGYTFLAKDHWGTLYNSALKTMMLNYAFEFVNKVYFHIGANNIRSQKAIERLGAKKIDEQKIAYHGEPDTMNFIYQIAKADWVK